MEKASGSIICGSPKYKPDKLSLPLKNLQWLPSASWVKLNLLILVFKNIPNLGAAYLSATPVSALDITVNWDH